MCRRGTRNSRQTKRARRSIFYTRVWKNFALDKTSGQRVLLLRLLQLRQHLNLNRFGVARKNLRLR